ncbi:TetR family transcriptional regulator [Rhodococcus sp. T2V]|uniref:TetR family transcriptional regulator n=1 Tax=Rhodococcus sp. T2V TaxID=3034164 RepID=UPI0023E155F8|nr:TetR family transcriptional regulator [Rhodococcus sp. T2V]MDF3312189.1 TetR family transcriptional regulator [Rhodococcus sp. T2V]
MRRVPADVRRGQFIEAALVLAAQQGVTALTVRRVAEAAGVSLDVVHDDGRGQGGTPQRDGGQPDPRQQRVDARGVHPPRRNRGNARHRRTSCTSACRNRGLWSIVYRTAPTTTHIADGR